MQTMAFPHAVRLRRFASARAAAQRGSLLIQFAVFLSIALLILGVVDLGYSFYAKRDLQRIADLAAIEAVQGMKSPNENATCVSAGMSSIDSNWPSPIERATTSSVVCGEWNKTKYAAPRHFLANTADTTAARVMLEGTSPTFIPIQWNRRVRAEAIAQRTEAATSFQIGSQLLNLNKDAPLGRVLTLIGLDAGKLTVLDANGLANAKITPSGLLKALGVDLGIEGLAVLTPAQLADLNDLTLLQILNASAAVLSDNIVKANVDAAIVILKDLKIGSEKLLDIKIPLLGDSSAGTSGILTFLSLGKPSSPNAAALDAQVGIGAILNTAIMIAANGHALQVQDTSLLNTVRLGLTVVEPPTIVVGRGVGNSAQVRLNLDIDSKGLPLLGDLLDVLGVRINLPIKIDGVSADGMLNEDNGVNCRSNPPSLNVDVASRVAKITIGNPALGPMDPSNLLIKTPLSLNVRGPITASVLQAHDETLLDIAKDQSKWTQTNPLLLGDTLAALTDAVFQLLGGLFSPPIINANWQGITTDGTVTLTKDAQIEALAKLYLEETKVNGFYKIEPAINLMLKGRGVEGSDGYIGKLVDGDFSFQYAIPVMTCGLLGIGLCSSDKWATGTFSEALTAYTSKVYGLGLLGIPLGNGYTSCANLLSALLAANSCVLSNLNNLLKSQSAHVNLSNANAEALKNNTCNGALCVLLKPLLTPLTGLLNGVGQALLSPLLKSVLGLELGRNEVKALDISCNSAELVF
ncbi:MAG: pilus assembly protein TadG-related protein [Comamonas sp.]